jgi:MFS superfamily sulfate permease-like transporter
MPPHLAIYLGVVLSILIHLYASSRLHFSYQVCTSSGQVSEKPIQELYAVRPPLAVINVEGDLFFGAVNDLEAAIQNALGAGVKVLVLRLRRVHRLAFTGIAALQWAILAARKAGVTILVSGVTHEARAMLETFHLADLIGRDHIFAGNEILFDSTRRTVEAGQRMLQISSK